MSTTSLFRCLSFEEDKAILDTMEKAAGSDMPDIDMKKYLNLAGMPLGEFVLFVRRWIKLSLKKHVFLIVKNAKPPTGALMSAINNNNKAFSH